MKIKYNVFSLRLHKETVQLLKKQKLEYGKSWNLFIYALLINWLNKKHYDKT